MRTFFISKKGAHTIRAVFCGAIQDSVSERLRRWTRNPLGSARRGSNPLAVEKEFLCACRSVCAPPDMACRTTTMLECCASAVRRNNWLIRKRHMFSGSIKNTSFQLHVQTCVCTSRHCLQDNDNTGVLCTGPRTVCAPIGSRHHKLLCGRIDPGHCVAKCSGASELDLA